MEDEDPYLKATKQKIKGKNVKTTKAIYREIPLNLKFTTGKDKYLNLNKNITIEKGQDEKLNKNKSIYEQEYSASDESDNLFNLTSNKKNEKSDLSKVKITQINVDDDDRIKEDFMNKIIDDKNNKNSEFDESNKSKTKGELSKEYSKTFGKGFAMLKKIGFQVGKGLGVKEQGITQPIEIKKRERNKGISNEETAEKDILNENYSDNEHHKHKKLHKLKAKKDLNGKMKMDQKIKDMDEFEKLVDNWDLIKNFIEKGKNKKIDFNKLDNVDNDIDLVLERDVDIDVSKFIIEKSNDYQDFIRFNSKMKKSFFERYKLKSYLKQNFNKRINNVFEDDIEMEDEKEREEDNHFSKMVIYKFIFFMLSNLFIRFKYLCKIKIFIYQ